MTMATQDPRTIVRISERLWSEEVARADAADPSPPYDPTYKFSAPGREFVVKTHYEPDPE